MGGRPPNGRRSRLQMVIERIQSNRESSCPRESDNSSRRSSHSETECNGRCEACSRASDCDCSQKTIPYPLGRSTTGTQFPTPTSASPKSPINLDPDPDPDHIIDLTSPTNRSPILIQESNPPSPEVIEVKSTSQSPASVTLTSSPSPPPAGQKPNNTSSERSRHVEYSPERTDSESERGSPQPPPSSAGGGAVSGSPKTYALAGHTFSPTLYELRAHPFITWPVEPSTGLPRAAIGIPAFPAIYTPHTRWGQIRIHPHPQMSVQVHGVPYPGEQQPGTSGLNNINRHHDDEYLDSDSVDENDGDVRPTTTWMENSRPGSRYMQHSHQAQFDCMHCPRKFKHKRSRDRHLKLHTGDRRYKCRECNAAFARSDHLKIHIRIHIANHRKQRLFKCRICGSSFESATAQAFHEQSHGQENGNPRVSVSNSRHNNNNNNNNNNNATNNNNNNNRNNNNGACSRVTFDCSHCTEIFSSASELAKHIVRVRTELLFESKLKEMIEKMCTCLVCKKRFPNAKQMEEHLQNGHVIPSRIAPQSNNTQDNTEASPPEAPESPEVGATRSDSRNTRNTPSPCGAKRKIDEVATEPTPEKRICEEDNPDKTYICSNCFAELPDFQSFLQHMEIHMVVPSTSNDNSRKVVSSLDNHNCCCKCEKIFEDPEEFLNHMSWDHVKPVYKCAICNEICDDKTSVKEHMRNTHSQKHYRCNMCSESYSIFHDEIAAKQHITGTHSRSREPKIEAIDNNTVPKRKDDKLMQTFCNSTTKQNHICSPQNEEKMTMTTDRDDNRFVPVANDRANELMKEFPTMASLNNKCPYCNEQCKSRSEFMNHLRSRHQPTDKMYKCNICDELFETVEKLATHKLKHCKIFRGDSCVQCKEAVNHKDLYFTHLFRHNTTYANDKKIYCLPFICIVCSQTLQSKLEVALHAAYHMKYVSQSHTKESNCLKCNRPTAPNAYGETSVVCDDCILPDHQEVLNETRLTTPKSEVVLSEEILALHCHLCKKSLESKEKLQTHLIEHNFFGMNEYSCYVCSSVFTAAVGLQTHLLEHNLSEMPYQCSACNEGFLFRAELENHGYIHVLQSQAVMIDESEHNQGTIGRDIFLQHALPKYVDS